MPVRISGRGRTRRHGSRSVHLTEKFFNKDHLRSRREKSSRWSFPGEQEKYVAVETRSFFASHRTERNRQLVPRNFSDIVHANKITRGGGGWGWVVFSASPKDSRETNSVAARTMRVYAAVVVPTQELLNERNWIRRFNIPKRTPCVGRRFSVGRHVVGPGDGFEYFITRFGATRARKKGTRRFATSFGLNFSPVLFPCRDTRRRLSRRIATMCYYETLLIQQNYGYYCAAQTKADSVGETIILVTQYKRKTIFWVLTPQITKSR